MTQSVTNQGLTLHRKKRFRSIIILSLTLLSTISRHNSAICMFWYALQDMGAVPGAYIAGALVPALIITVLFYFDHSVSSQLAQTPDFNLRKPSAYNWDLFLLGFMTFACGILGIPPVNGVLPQVCIDCTSSCPHHQHTVSLSSPAYSLPLPPCFCCLLAVVSFAPPLHVFLCRTFAGCVCSKAAEMLHDRAQSTAFLCLLLRGY